MNTKFEIPYINLGQQWEEEKLDLSPIINRIFSKGHLIGGEEINKFENDIAKYINKKFAVALKLDGQGKQ